MGLFSRKEKKEDIKKSYSNTPELPELPKLPELPPMHELSHDDVHLPQLPTFPNSSLGNKFSQNTIKEAVAGKKEEKGVFNAEDFPGQNKGMMQKPLQKSFSQEYENYQDRTMSPVRKSFTQNYDENGMVTQKSFSQEEISDMEEKEAEEEEERPAHTPVKTRDIHPEFIVKNYMTKKAEPVFIRIDKFEEGMKVFQDIKSQISDIERLIKDTREIKTKEEQELISWEKEIQAIKNEIGKIDSEIFSRLE